MSSLLILVSIFFSMTTGQLTFQNPVSFSSMCYTLQTTTNGIRLSASSKGWIGSDSISKITATTFYITIESLSGSDTGFGPAESPDAYCNRLFYKPSRVGGSATCWSDFLTYYTTTPAGSASSIPSSAMATVGHTYKVYIDPLTSTSGECMQYQLTGIITTHRFL